MMFFSVKVKRRKQQKSTRKVCFLSDKFVKKLKNVDVLRLEATPSAAETAPASAALGFGPGFVYAKCTSIDFLSVQGLDGGIGFLVIGHVDESETFAPSSFTICDDADRFNRSEFRKHGFQVAFVCVVRQIAYVDVHSFFLSTPPLPKYILYPNIHQRR
jgi:hypothetical protein